MSVSGNILPYKLALCPETEGVKHRDHSKPQPDDCHTVEVHGMSGAVQNCPIFDMYLAKQDRLEKPVPFWGVKVTHDEKEANMELIYVEVTLGVSTEIVGALKGTSSAITLETYINPYSTVKVKLPLYVNHRALVFGEKLFFYKPAGKPIEKKRKDTEEVDPLADFVKSSSRKQGKSQRKG